jgi:hypothetical protein
MSFNLFCLVYLFLIPIILGIGSLLLGYYKVKYLELNLNKNIILLIMFSILWPGLCILGVIFIPFFLLYLLGQWKAK